MANKARAGAAPLPCAPQSRPHQRQHQRQRGSIVVLFALTLFFLVGCIGLALDAAQLYNRQSELQNFADGAALAAARQLDGSAAGVTAAAAKAAGTAGANRYGYGLSNVVWSDAALSFSSAPDTAEGAWLDLATARAAPGRIWYARIDTGALDAAAGQVQTLVLASLSGATGSLASRRLAVAGRSAVNVAPLAVCAMGAAAAETRVRGALSETVAYGFRQGVGYDLLKLNPDGAAPVSYLVDPIDTPEQAANPANLAPAVLNAYMCAGRLAMAALPASLHVSPMPAAGFAYSDQLNARFDLYPPAGACSPVSAPPDRNVKPYTPAAAVWMAATPAGTTAAAAAKAPLRTIADLPNLDDDLVAGPSYGVLWSYTAALPAPGAGAFTLADWAGLYPVSAGAAATAANAGVYPALPKAPYSRAAGAYFSAPAAGHTGLAERRVLNVPLLRCPVAAGAPATVLAVGRFFMSVPATATSISGEFVGLAAPAALVGPVGLFQ